MTQLMAEQSRDLLELRRRRLREQRQNAGDHAPDSCTRACCDEDGWIGLEVSQALAVSERQVGGRIDTARRLARYVGVRTAAESGLLQAWTTTVLLDKLDQLRELVSPDLLDSMERSTVAWLLEKPRTVGQLTARMRRLLLRARADAGQDVPGRDARSRSVRVWPAGSDGLATVLARIPEPDAAALHATLLALAADPVDEADARTVEQRRCDLLTTLVTGAPAVFGCVPDVDLMLRAPGRLQVRVDVTVPTSSLQGGSDPARVPGFGDISADAARRLVASTRDTVARALFVDPTTGGLQGFSAASEITWLSAMPAVPGYQHPALMDEAVRLRDVTCRAPGCLRSAQRCDCDHVVAYPTGETSVGNTCCMCRRHHRLKTHARGWSAVLDERDRMVWTTPTGQQYVTEPHDYSETLAPVPVAESTTGSAAASSGDQDVPPF